jgi:hypothetical protein
MLPSLQPGQPSAGQHDAAVPPARCSSVDGKGVVNMMYLVSRRAVAGNLTCSHHFNSRATCSKHPKQQTLARGWQPHPPSPLTGIRRIREPNLSADQLPASMAISESGHSGFQSWTIQCTQYKTEADLQPAQRC